MRQCNNCSKWTSGRRLGGGICDNCYAVGMAHGTLELILTPKGKGCINTQGYRVHRIRDILFYEHRLNMVKHLGRPLLPGEVVHHGPEGRGNNDLSNLRLCSSQSEHMKQHHPRKYFGINEGMNDANF